MIRSKYVWGVVVGKWRGSGGEYIDDLVGPPTDIVMNVDVWLLLPPTYIVMNVERVVAVDVRMCCVLTKMALVF